MSSAPKKTPRVPETADVSEVEKKIISKMQEQYGERLRQQGISDMTVLRYIRGYKDDVHPEQKALEMMGAMLHWREEMKVSAVAVAKYDKEELFKSIWTSGIHGKDKMGHLIYVTKIGAVDGSKLYKHFTIEEVINFHIKEMETIQNLKDSLWKESGRRLYKQIVILDLKGLGMSHLGSKFMEPFKKFSKIDQEMYPETLFKMFIVNAGFLVKSMWAVAGPFIDPITKQNIVFGEQEMKTFMDVDQIPKYLGGTCRCDKCLITPFIPGPEAETRPAAPLVERISLQGGATATTPQNAQNASSRSSSPHRKRTNPHETNGNSSTATTVTTGSPPAGPQTPTDAATHIALNAE